MHLVHVALLALLLDEAVDEGAADLELLEIVLLQVFDRAQTLPVILALFRHLDLPLGTRSMIRAGFTIDPHGRAVPMGAAQYTTRGWRPALRPGIDCEPPRRAVTRLGSNVGPWAGGHAALSTFTFGGVFCAASHRSYCARMFT